MKYSVNLEAPFAFSARWYWIGAGFLLLAVLVTAAVYYIFRHLSRTDSARMKWHRLAHNREKYLKRIDEIEAAKLKPDEEDRLLDKRAKLQNSEKIAQLANAVTTLLYRNDKGTAATDKLKRAMKALDALTPENEKKLQNCLDQLGVLTYN